MSASSPALQTAPLITAATKRRGRWILLVACASWLLLGGCGHSSQIAKANDELRIKNLELQSQVDQLTSRNKELELELKRVSATATSMPEDVRANTPHVASLKVGRLSFARDTDGDGRPDSLTLYLDPADGLGRFVQMVGTVTVNAAILPADADAVTIGRATFGPREVRDAYRSGITGVFYVFDVRIKLPERSASGAVPDSCQVRVVYSDGLTGESFAADRTISLK